MVPELRLVGQFILEIVLGLEKRLVIREGRGGDRMGCGPLHELLLELLVLVAARGLDGGLLGLLLLAQGDLGLRQGCRKRCGLGGGIPNTPFRQ